MSDKKLITTLAEVKGSDIKPEESFQTRSQVQSNDQHLQRVLRLAGTKGVIVTTLCDEDLPKDAQGNKASLQMTGRRRRVATVRPYTGRPIISPCSGEQKDDK